MIEEDLKNQCFMTKSGCMRIVNCLNKKVNLNLGYIEIQNWNLRTKMMLISIIRPKAQKRTKHKKIQLLTPKLKNKLLNQPTLSRNQSNI